jgi:type IV pilus assembly protein PilO
MTLSEDFNFEGGEFEEAGAESSYPVVFGITFTPRVSGILLGLLGIAGSAYMVMNMVMPAWETFQQQQKKEGDLKTDIQRKEARIWQKLRSRKLKFWGCFPMRKLWILCC